MNTLKGHVTYTQHDHKQVNKVIDKTNENQSLIETDIYGIKQDDMLKELWNVQNKTPKIASKCIKMMYVQFTSLKSPHKCWVCWTEIQ